jgi:hypothetical protein
VTPPADDRQPSGSVLRLVPRSVLIPTFGVVVVDVEAQVRPPYPLGGLTAGRAAEHLDALPGWACTVVVTSEQTDREVYRGTVDVIATLRERRVVLDTPAVPHDWT